MSDFSPRSHEVGSLLLAGGSFLVIGAVILSLMESSFSGSVAVAHKNRDLEDLMRRGEVQLSRIKIEMGLERKNLIRLKEHLAESREFRQLEESLNQVKGENSNLATEIDRLEEEVRNLQAQRLSYQARTREYLWRKMTHQKLEEKDLLRPLEFKNALITGVDEAGLMIRHESGVSRIPVAHLSPALREELDLNVKEAEEKMAKIYDRDAKLKKGLEVRKVEKKETPEEKDAAQLAAGKEKVRKLLELISHAEAEAANARAQDRFSKNRSAPASLETFAQRAHRFQKLSLKYRSSLEATILKIQLIDPSYKTPGH